jgi:DNA ligase 1
VTAELTDGDSAQVKGSGSSVYTLKNSGGVYSCTCPAWRNQSVGIERRTCKHLRAYRGDEAESARLGSENLTGRPVKPVRIAAPGEAASEDEEGPPVLLAHKWENDVDLTGWWLSEKLDGVRAWWDGETFLSRLGNKFFAPPWFTARFPKTPLDGELWGGRKLFQRTVGIVKRQDESALWKELQFVVFDAPAHGGTFEERVAFIDRTVADLKVDWLKAHTHYRCEGTEHLRAELARVEALGGEGLMVRQPQSRYEAGRSNTLLKVKSFHDAEACVRAHVPGLGRHKGRLGALLVELPDGTQFNVGTGFSDAEREKPPALGAIITFRYQELSNAGVPRFPSYIGERIDGSLHAASTVKRVEAVNAASPVKALNAASPAKAKPQPKAALSPQKLSQARYFEFEGDSSAKFWEIRVDGSAFVTRYGKIGSEGQSTQKDYDSDEKAKAEAAKLKFPNLK